MNDLDDAVGRLEDNTWPCRETGGGAIAPRASWAPRIDETLLDETGARIGRHLRWIWSTAAEAPTASMARLLDELRRSETKSNVEQTE